MGPMGSQSSPFACTPLLYMRVLWPDGCVTTGERDWLDARRCVGDRTISRIIRSVRGAESVALSLVHACCWLEAARRTTAPPADVAHCESRSVDPLPGPH